MAQGGGSRSGGIGFVGLLTITFIVLKLVKVIDWNWLWVLSPIWVTLLILIATCVIVAWVQERRDRNAPWRRLR